MSVPSDGCRRSQSVRPSCGSESSEENQITFGAHAVAVSTNITITCRVAGLYSFSNPRGPYANAPLSRAAWFHVDRTAGGDRDHRDPDRAVAARGSEGPRGGRAHQVRQQPQTARVGAAQLP